MDSNKKKNAADLLLLIGYVAFIYLTLPVTPAFTNYLSAALGSNFALLAGALVILPVPAASAIFYRNIRDKGISFYLGLAAAISVYAVLLIYYTPIVVEKLHLLEYGILACLAMRYARGMRPQNKRHLFVAAAVVIVGYCDELIQKFIPNRVYDPRDVALNILGGFLAFVIMRMLDYDG
ncbi:MAG: VanZ family protein [Candidatus Omnitrophica bacterium]|nr:VanZ family protein [Candidatus Omnitrophota bacterium]